jgi:hypothetical protein
VDDVKFMQVIQAETSLKEVNEGFVFRDLSLLFEIMKQRAILRVFKGEIHILIILEIVIHLNNIGMIDSFLDLDLSLQILRRRVLFDEFLADLQERG